MTDKTRNILILCTGNSARSILAEALLNYWGGKAGNGAANPKFRAYSAGSFPTGTVNPFAIKLLERMNLPTTGLRSKSWGEFATDDAPKMDFVFTVCDQAAGEVCPIWPGQPITAHWGISDPAAVTGDDKDKALAFAEGFRQLENRIRIFASLPLDKLDRMSLQVHLDEIGKTTP